MIWSKLLSGRPDAFFGFFTIDLSRHKKARWSFNIPVIGGWWMAEVGFEEVLVGSIEDDVLSNGLSLSPSAVWLNTHSFVSIGASLNESNILGHVSWGTE